MWRRYRSDPSLSTSLPQPCGWGTRPVDSDQVLPSRLILTTADENKKTEMHWIDIQFGVSIPDNTFSLSRLEKK